MSNVTKTVFKNFGEKAKVTALEGKERFLKWKETEKMKKHKHNVQEKDALGNQILFIKKEISETEEKVRHLRGTTLQTAMVTIEGMEIAISIETILAQYEASLATLLKRKEKRIKAFLALEEKINSEKDIAEKIEAIERRKEMRYRSIKIASKESCFAELLPLIAEMPNFVPTGEEIGFEESFGLLELRFKEDRLECFHNGLIINIKLDMFHSIQQVGIVDWRNDEAIYLADGHAENITLLNWKNSSAVAYQHEFFEMARALKYVYMHHFANTNEG